MLNPEIIFKQIMTLTSDLIKTGICCDQNFPNMRNLPCNIKEIGIREMSTHVFLKNIPYNEMYDEMIKLRAFNVKMLDGAMIQIQYKFCDQILCKYRLSFLPSPYLYEYQNFPELYMEDELYMDIIDKCVVSFPIRFDFDNSDVACEVEHPISHLTLGQYKNCRIPVSSAITPYHFLTFIVRNFYHTAYYKYCSQMTNYKDFFSESISEAERKLIHINLQAKA